MNMLRRLAVTFALAFLSLAGTANAVSQAPAGSWGTNGDVNAVAQSGSKVYLGGAFTAVGPITGPGTAFPLGSDQHVSLPLVSGGGHLVFAVVADGSGGWYVGGAFTRVGGVARSNLAHVLSDGSVDPAFAPDPDDSVRALSLAGSTLYVGGGFDTIAGAARSHLAAVSTTTGALTNWAPQTSAVTSITSILATGDGPNDSVFVGGFFSELGGETRTNLGQVDAIDGEASAWAPEPNGFVDALAIDGTELYVGGRFTSIAGSSRGRVAAFDTSGSGPALDADWNPNANGSVFALTVWRTAAGSRLYVGGDFGSIGGGTHGRIAAVGTASPGVHSDTGGEVATWTPSADGLVQAIVVDGSTVYLGGNFQHVNAAERQGLAAVDDATGATLNWDARLSDRVSSPAQVFELTASGTRLYAGGSFALANTLTREHLAALDTATGAATGWNPGADGDVSALVASAGTVYAGGDFDTVGGVTRHHAAALDAGDATVGSWHPDPDGGVRTIAVAGSVAYLGGFFGNAGGATRDNAAAVAADPASDGDATGWHPDPSGLVTSILPSGSTVYVGGTFGSIGGQSRTNLGAVQASGPGTAVPSWQADTDGSVESLALAGGRLYAGGQFESITHSTATTRHYIAALNPADGTVLAWNPDADWEVLSIIPAGSSVYVAGGFSEIGGASRSGLAELDAATAQATGWDPNPDTIVRSCVFDSAGALHAGGDFRAIDEIAQPGYARFDPAPAAGAGTGTAPTQDPGTTTTQQAAGPQGSTQAPPVADRIAPRLALSGPRKLVGKRLVVYVKTDEDATVTATGRISIPGGAARVLKLGRTVKTAHGGKRLKLSLTLSKRVRKRVAAALARGKRVTATVGIVAADGAGNAAKSSRRIKIK